MVGRLLGVGFVLVTLAGCAQPATLDTMQEELLSFSTKQDVTMGNLVVRGTTCMHLLLGEPGFGPATVTASWSGKQVGSGKMFARLTTDESLQDSHATRSPLAYQFAPIAGANATLAIFALDGSNDVQGTLKIAAYAGIIQETRSATCPRNSTEP